MCKQLRIKGREIASIDTLKKKFADLKRLDPDSIYVKEEDIMKPQEPA